LPYFFFNPFQDIHLFDYIYPTIYYEHFRKKEEWTSKNSKRLKIAKPVDVTKPTNRRGSIVELFGFSHTPNDIESSSSIAKQIDSNSVPEPELQLSMSARSTHTHESSFASDNFQRFSDYTRNSRHHSESALSITETYQHQLISTKINNEIDHYYRCNLQLPNFAASHAYTQANAGLRRKQAFLREQNSLIGKQANVINSPPNAITRDRALSRSSFPRYGSSSSLSGFKRSENNGNNFGGNLNLMGNNNNHFNTNSPNTFQNLPKVNPIYDSSKLTSINLNRPHNIRDGDTSDGSITFLSNNRFSSERNSLLELKRDSRESAPLLDKNSQPNSPQNSQPHSQTLKMPNLSKTKTYLMLNESTPYNTNLSGPQSPILPTTVESNPGSNALVTIDRITFPEPPSSYTSFPRETLPYLNIVFNSDDFKALAHHAKAESGGEMVEIDLPTETGIQIQTHSQLDSNNIIEESNGGVNISAFDLEFDPVSTPSLFPSITKTFHEILSMSWSHTNHTPSGTTTPSPSYHNLRFNRPSHAYHDIRQHLSSLLEDTSTPAAQGDGIMYGPVNKLNKHKHTITPYIDASHPLSTYFTH
jgi:hypothetical protein